MNFERINMREFMDSNANEPDVDAGDEVKDRLGYTSSPAMKRLEEDGRRRGALRSKIRNLEAYSACNLKGFLLG